MVAVLRALRMLVTSSVLASAACGGHDAAPDGRDMPHVEAAIVETPPTIADAAIATYWGGQARQITLKDGAFTGPKGERVELLRQHYVVGDLEGDGAVDAVVALTVSNAGAEDGRYIAVLRHLGTDTISLGTTALGRDVDVRQLAVDGRRIVVTVSRPPSSGPDERLVFELGAGELVRVGGA
jgi:hypothetical protein